MNKRIKFIGDTRLWFFVILWVLTLGSSGCSKPVTTASSDPIEKRVTQLIEDSVTSSELEVKAFKELEAMGDDGVPYMVSHLKDLRPLPSKGMLLENHFKDAFEGSRRYSPETVHDALSAILNQITGQNFEFVFNGATKQERIKDTKEWITWCRSRYPNKVAVCGDAED